MNTIGDRIRLERKRLKMTQSELSKKLKISRAAVSQWEIGDTKGMKPDNLINVARALDVNVEWLVTGRGDKSRQSATEGTHKDKAAVDKVFSMMPSAGMEWIAPLKDLIERLENQPDMSDNQLFVELGKVSMRIQFEWLKQEFDPSTAAAFFDSAAAPGETESRGATLAEFVINNLPKS